MCSCSTDKRCHGDTDPARIGLNTCPGGTWVADAAGCKALANPAPETPGECDGEKTRVTAASSNSLRCF
jgi:hypothetical protein